MQCKRATNGVRCEREAFYRVSMGESDEMIVLELCKFHVHKLRNFFSKIGGHTIEPLEQHETPRPS